MSEIYNCIDKIRNAIQIEEIKTTIPNYEILAAALDIVSDAEDGIASYLSLEDKNERGINYIYINGVLSLLMVEIQAVRVIYKLLLGKDLNITSDKHLDIIRLLRNKIFAHPVDLGVGGSRNDFGIIASQLTTFSFIPYAFNGELPSSNDKTLYEKVEELARNRVNHNPVIDIKELIKNKNSSLETYLNEICETLFLPEQYNPQEYTKISDNHPLMVLLKFFGKDI
ncbi:MAG: hypothetical protein SOW21_09375 [[Actinobacillus] rossii]|nr:hypothetical protein [[Actinobacillus] rossii]